LTSVCFCIIVVSVTLYSTDAFPKPVKLSLPKFSKPPRPEVIGLDGISDAIGGEYYAHPIDQLIVDADKDFKRVLSTQAFTLEETATQYRKRRGRHPPPGFDAWYGFASSTGAVIVEEFWDQIYHDLEPFQEAAPSTLRRQAAAFPRGISIREDKISAKRNNTAGKTALWMHMLQTLAQQEHVKLPDIDILLNVNIEPSLIVPWDTIDDAMSYPRKFMVPPEDVLTAFPEYKDELPFNYTFQPEWLGPRLTHPASIMGPRPYWELVRPACRPESPTRVEPILTDIWHPKGHTSDAHQAINMFPLSAPKVSVKGYVRNWTTATDPCNSPHLQGLHGAFVRPEAMSACVKLFPLFGAGKMRVNNDILLPGPDEWNNTRLVPEANGEGTLAWEERQDKLFWRGPDTGGHSTKINWQRMHRHRFVSMLNGSQLALAEKTFESGNASLEGLGPGKNFRLPISDPYRLATQENGRLGEWVQTWADVAFTEISCDVWSMNNLCPYNAAYFGSLSAPADIDKQRRYKYAAIIDGNGGNDGGNFTRALNNGIVTLRATVFRNWYDSRLWPWVHYVPMDNTFMDIYGIMEYFIGTEGFDQPLQHKHPRKRDESNLVEKSFSSGRIASAKRAESSGHDAEAQRIAESARNWSRKVLRKEDMLIYTYRLLLEYARMMHDERERLGWVEDLLAKDGK
jgi:hypothetical protein